MSQERIKKDNKIGGEDTSLYMLFLIFFPDQDILGYIFG